MKTDKYNSSLSSLSRLEHHKKTLKKNPGSIYCKLNKKWNFLNERNLKNNIAFTFTMPKPVPRIRSETQTTIDGVLIDNRPLTKQLKERNKIRLRNKRSVDDYIPWKDNSDYTNNKTFNAGGSLPFTRPNTGDFEKNKRFKYKRNLHQYSTICHSFHKSRLLKRKPINEDYEICSENRKNMNKLEQNYNKIHKKYMNSYKKTIKLINRMKKIIKRNRTISIERKEENNLNKQIKSIMAKSVTKNKCFIYGKNGKGTYLPIDRKSVV